MPSIEELLAQMQQQGGQQQQPSMGFGGGAPSQPGGFGISSGYNSPGAVSKWLWSQGYSGIGPMTNNAPPIIQQILQQAGMKMDPTQYRSVGGYTPQFADAVNQAVYPGMNFRTGAQSMGELIGPGQQSQMPQQEQNPYGDFMQQLMERYKQPSNQGGLMEIVRRMQAGEI